MNSIQFKVKISKQGPRGRIIWIPKEHFDEVASHTGELVSVKIIFLNKRVKKQ